MAQTSERISSIAARYANLTAARLIALAAKDSTAESAAADIRAISASALRQDETPLRRLIKRITGQ